MSTRPDEWEARGEEALNRPRELFDRMREECPVAWNNWRGWTVFRHEDVVNISRDPETWSSDDAWDEIGPEDRAIPLRIDPPDHTRYRKMLMPLFAPKRIKAHEEKCRVMAREMLGPLLEAGKGDWVAAFSGPYPVRTLCQFLGWPVEDAEQIQEWSESIVTARVQRDIDTFNRLAAVWNEYIDHFFEENRRNPGENVSAWLLEQTFDERPLTQAEMRSIMRLMLQAGHGTTTASLGNAVAYLAQNPEEQQALRDDPSLIPSGAEEILRLDNPLVRMQRVATQDVELHGKLIRAGEEVGINYVSANRDPRAFPDADKCVLDRKPRNLLFGIGIHTCLGAPLARLELKVVLEELLKATSSFSVDPAGEITRKTYSRNEHVTLPLVFTPA